MTVITDPSRTAAMLEEMGLGPLWLRRDAAEAPAEQMAATLVNSAAEVEPAPAESSVPPLDAAPPSLPLVPQPVPASLLENGDDEAVRAISQMNWDQLEQAVSTCTRCNLCKGRTRTVFGVGDRKARWLFIGEGPGREEDLRGEPFVGRAGQLLDNMLAALQLARGRNAYIANVVKCRATDENGKDRRPTAQEAATCLPYLQRQIELIQPDVMVALGKTAAVSLLGLDPETPVSGLRGKVHRYDERPLVVTYHPAYLLRTPLDKRKTWADLCLANAEYQSAGTKAET
ncbi:MAG TPA: uracil-DNA glycosylase [Noviherbaspirillum sp.]